MKSVAAVIVLLGLGLSPAAACGWDGELCCKGAEACKVDGLACIDGRCRPEPECGGNGEVCCPGEECDLHSLVCLGGSCTPCGKEGEPVCNEDGVSPCNEGLEASGGICAPPCGANGEECCPGNKCDAHSLGCVGGTCVPCGKEGQPLCTEDGVSPCNEGLEDSDGICSPPCGSIDEPCCGGESCKRHDLACVSDICTPCGGDGEPVCTEDGVDACNEGLEESEGVCVPLDCGEANEECCPGDVCEGGNICAQGFCLPCGALGKQTCAGGSPCADDLVAIGGFCQPAPEECGGKNEVCCPGNKCEADGTICRMGFCSQCGTEGSFACDGDEPCADGLEVSSGGLCIGTKKLSFGSIKK